MSSRPRVSAVIPAYDRERTITRAIDSVLEQSEPPVELIVVDDGSTDATLERIRAYGGRVRPIAQANAGAGAARNHGVREASGEWIAFLDSDDYWNREHLERMGDAIVETKGRADVYFGNTRRPESEGGELQWARAGFRPEGATDLVDDARAWAFASKQPLMLQSSLFRRERYLAVGGIWEALRAREDTHLFFKLLVGAPACAVDYCSTQMTSDDDSGGRLSEKYGLSDRHYEQTERLYIDLLERLDLTPAERRELAFRIAAAQLRLARSALSAGRYLSAASFSVRALCRSPRRFWAAARRRVSSGDVATEGGSA
ncbi:MAG: glycosyltransferase family 2 protein [Planctomycetes bacterium]|nr:glycosyltransferase family 2 protein [Planctomycetota bacterium]